MKKLISNYKIYLVFFIGVLLVSLLTSLLNIIGIPSNITNIIIMIIFIIFFVILGFYKGKNSSEKGYVQGIIIGALCCLILMLISLITFNFSIRSFLYYIILILSSTTGSMIGINKKNNT